MSEHWITAEYGWLVYDNVHKGTSTNATTLLEHYVWISTWVEEMLPVWAWVEA